MDKLLLKVEEAADLLSLGRSKVWQLIQDGRLETVRIGRARRVPYAAVRALVEQLAGPAEDRH